MTRKNHVSEALSSLLAGDFGMISIKARAIFKKTGFFTFLAAIILSIVSLSIEAQILLKSQRWPDSAVSEFEQRYRPLARELRGCKKVGFYCGEVRNIKWWGTFNLAQYTLAPIIVIDSVKEDYVIYDLLFAQPDTVRIPAGYSIVRKVSEVLFLIKGNER